jgi:aminopeptidase N
MPRARSGSARWAVPGKGGKGSSGRRTPQGALAVGRRRDGPASETRARARVVGRRCDRLEAFRDFHDRWQDDHLVIDKWFALQAVSSLPSALETVRALSQHRLFSLKTPNKVRALIGAFANMNPVGFNRPDGAGYDFVADCVLEIDRFNPQIAARLMGAFKSWRMLEPGRRAHARKVLDRVAKTDGLSRDTYEIVTKTIE